MSKIKKSLTMLLVSEIPVTILIAQQHIILYERNLTIVQFCTGLGF